VRLRFAAACSMVVAADAAWGAASPWRRVLCALLLALPAAASAAGHDAAASVAAGGNLSASFATSARCDSTERPLQSKCTGCPPMFNGKPCASTTWYEDKTKGSCGCGVKGKTMVEDDYWTLTSYTAALNTLNLDPQQPGLTWCPSGCGQCYEICTTGGAVNTLDKANPAGQCQVFKITNRCSDGWSEDRPDWCSQKISAEECRQFPEKCMQPRSTNIFGYSAHFDLQDAHRQVQHGLGWDNPEVTFELVSCDKWDGPKEEKCDLCEAR